MKMWDGRFSKPSDRLMEEFHSSLPFDRKLIEEDIQGSMAWAGALKRAGIYKEDEHSRVIHGLESILHEYKSGHIDFLASDEDIHMAVERLLIERVGEAGARLHTGRSRNDQVVTDVRMYVKKALTGLREGLTALQRVLYKRAEDDIDVIMPGYTHLQQAQPVMLAQYWLSFFFLLEREKSRLSHAFETADILPLGAGALAGSGFDLDRKQIAADLSFGTVSPNSIDAVASRDFILETLAAIGSLGIHLSRYAEDLIIWSSREFSFVEIDDAWATGSSMMPQKKNPDSLELIRGKCGRFTGNYTRFAVTLKGVGYTYYKDLQEDKEPIFDSVEQMQIVLAVFSSVIATLKIKRERIAGDLDPFLLATDLADYLVGKKVPFREAHKIVGRIVGYCSESNAALDRIPLEQLKKFSGQFDEDVMKVFSWEESVSKRSIYGGTSPDNVRRQLKTAAAILEQSKGNARKE